MGTVFLVAIVVLAGTGGEIAATYAMRQTGEVMLFAPRAVLGCLGRAFGRGWMWIGIALMALAFFSMLVLLSWKEVSYVSPVTALSYAVGALGGQVFLGERVDRVRWAGVVLVCVGVALVSAS